MTRSLTLGPILFHWPAEQKLDFYARIADEAPVDTVYLGEVICSKRSPFFEQHYDEVAERLQRGGKKVVFSSLTEVVLKRERKAIEGFCELDDHEIEINNTSALLNMDGKAHRVGPLMNVYNEMSMAYLAKGGATHFCLPVELPGTSAKLLADKAAELGAGVEMQVYGRASLAVSARCYHARAHARTKDNCQFVCEDNPDGMPLKTLDGKPFLAVNGIQTLSQSYLNYLKDLPELMAAGITHYRLSPHTHDMVAIAQIFRDVLDDKVSSEEAGVRLSVVTGSLPFSNGFWHGKAGHLRV
ncbi:U32 family peptidase [Labrenzia sp. PHM005]|uniref:ubiquinone anaerobic biosynthesis protein UbiV n=1 Tax=Labrenzia sp. PHM005 TaxID=2590016 RepID=UPI00113FFB4D|nr:U32 family peptidase [Labrenzia sp. PHM005]QDG76557.1 U32 family peptidase [Labrenzia sp. PHM005]